jgi:hypothetical protein
VEDTQRIQPPMAGTEQPGTTVITVGLTPPIIGGGLALGYLAIRRMAGNGQQGDGRRQGATNPRPAMADAAGRAAGTVADGAQQAADAAGGAMQALAGTAGQVLTTAGEAAATGGRTVRDTATGAVSLGRTGVRELPRMARENPAITLGIGIGLGAVAGLLIPPTRTEQQVLAPATESIAQQVKTAAQDTAEKVQLVAEEATATVKESATEVGLVPSGTGGT